MNQENILVLKIEKSDKYLRIFAKELSGTLNSRIIGRQMPPFL